MNIQEFKTVIKDRDRIENETQGAWYAGIEQCHKKLVDIITQDFSSSINYLKNECTADEFSWLSEVFNEIVEKEPSMEFINALKHLEKKYPEETETYNLHSFIEEAENLFESLQ